MKTGIFNLEKISGWCEKIIYFFVMNLLVLAGNIPVLLFFLFVGISQVRECLPFFLFLLLPLPLSLSALFYGMNRMARGTERGAFKDFMEGYKADVKQKLKLAAGQLFAILIFWTNVEFFAKQFPILPLMILFLFLFLFTILLTPYLYLLISRYEMDNFAIVKASCALMVKNPAGTLGNVAVLGILLMALEIMAGTVVLFIMSVYGFLVVYINKPMMKKLEAGDR